MIKSIKLNEEKMMQVVDDEVESMKEEPFTVDTIYRKALAKKR